MATEHVTVPNIPHWTEVMVSSVPQSIFTFSFPFWEKSDLHVRVDGVPLDAADWEVTGTGSVKGGFSGGTIALDVALTTLGQRVLIYRDQAPLRESDFSRGAMPIDAFNTALDKIAAFNQEHRNGIARSVRAPIGESQMTEAPALDDRKLRVASYDVDGNPAVGPLTSDLIRLVESGVGLISIDGMVSAATVALLQLVDVSELPAGAPAMTLSYGELGDGGGRFWAWRTGDFSALVAADEVTTGQGDGGGYVAPSSDRTGASGAWVALDRSNVEASAHYGNTDAGVQAAADGGAAYLDLGGAVVHTTREVRQLTLKPRNGTLTADNRFGYPSVVKPGEPIRDVALQRWRTKSPVLEWEGRTILWLGTSIPHQGAGLDGYPEQFADRLLATVINNAWSGSKAGWDPTADADNINNIKCLSMTENDRLWGVSEYGSASIYGDDFDLITKAAQMTADARIMAAYAEADISVVALDHNHNDRHLPLGTLTPPEAAITAVSLGATTTVTLASAAGWAAGDGIVLRVEGIPKADHLAARVEAVSGNDVTININTSGYTGSLISGTATRLDRNTIAGAWLFVMHYCCWAANVHDRAQPYFLLAGAPSEYTTGAPDDAIFGNAENVRQIAELWGPTAGFFDIAHELQLTLRDHQTYLGDNVHPVTRAQRRVIADHWVRWALGGALPVRNPRDYLPRVAGTEFTDQREPVYSEFFGGFLTPDFLFGGSTPVITEDFADLGGWTTMGNAPAVAAAPWGIGNAMKVERRAAVSSGQAYIVRDIADIADGFDLEFDILAPVTAGLTSNPSKTINLVKMKNDGGGPYYALELVINASNIRLRMTVWDVPSSSRELFGLQAGPLVAGQRHTIRIRAVRTTGSHGSGLMVFFDGVPAMSAAAPDDGDQTPWSSIEIGAIDGNFDGDVDFWIGDLSLNSLIVHPYGTQHTGVIDLGDIALNVVNGRIIGVTAGGGSDVVPATLDWSTSTNDDGVATSSTEAITGINAPIVLRLTEGANSGLITSSYRKNGASWVAWSGSVEISVSPGDTLAFRCSHGQSGTVATSITVKNVSNGDATLDTWSVTVNAEADKTPATLAFEAGDLNTGNSAFTQLRTSTETVTGIDAPIQLRFEKIGDCDEYRLFINGSDAGLFDTTPRTVTVEAGDTVMMQFWNRNAAAAEDAAWRIVNLSDGNAVVSTGSLNVLANVDGATTLDPITLGAGALYQGSDDFAQQRTNEVTLSGISVPVTLRFEKTGGGDEHFALINGVSNGQFTGGPLDIEVEAGDTLMLQFWNRTSSPVTVGWKVTNLTGAAVISTGTLSVPGKD